MKTLLALAALTLAVATPAFASDDATTDIISRHKAKKPLGIADVGTLMGSSERWCYSESEGSCAWSDIYLEVTADTVTYEIGNAWSDTLDIAFTDTGLFEDGRYVCETGADWVPTVRATRREDGAVIGGRELFALKAEVAMSRQGSVIDCFDYLYLRSDADLQTITLLQRQYTDDVYVPENDVDVTLHFDAESAAGLTWRW